MKKKIILIIVILIILIALILFLFFNREKVYTVKIKSVDEYSPDIQLIVLRNGREYSDYKYIKYNNSTDTILCYSKTPVINKYELKDSDKNLIIVLQNGKEISAEVVK